MAVSFTSSERRAYLGAQREALARLYEVIQIQSQKGIEKEREQETTNKEAEAICRSLNQVLSGLKDSIDSKIERLFELFNKMDELEKLHKQINSYLNEQEILLSNLPNNINNKIEEIIDNKIFNINNEIKSLVKEIHTRDEEIQLLRKENQKMKARIKELEKNMRSSEAIKLKGIVIGSLKIITNNLESVLNYISRVINICKSSSAENIYNILNNINEEIKELINKDQNISLKSVRVKLYTIIDKMKNENIGALWDNMVEEMNKASGFTPACINIRLIGMGYRDILENSLSELNNILLKMLDIDETMEVPNINEQQTE